MALHQAGLARKRALAGIPSAGPYLRLMAKYLLLIPLFAILAAAIWYAIGLSASAEGPPMPITGYLAMGLGILFSLVVGCGLMALLFYSNRHGYDDQTGIPDDRD